ncbi:hypothetical protein K0M31_011985, partial [Melipona bicolor]
LSTAVATTLRRNGTIRGHGEIYEPRGPGKPWHRARKHERHGTSFAIRGKIGCHPLERKKPTLGSDLVHTLAARNFHDGNRIIIAATAIVSPTGICTIPVKPPSWQKRPRHRVKGAIGIYSVLATKASQLVIFRSLQKGDKEGFVSCFAENFGAQSCTRLQNLRRTMLSMIFPRT